MSQHDFVIDNQNAPASRADINNALQALASCSSGTTAPVATYANMLWYDTTNDLLKIRNEANSAWITLGTVDQTNNVFNPNFLPATQAEAEAGTNNIKGMTALRVAQAIAVLGGIADVNVQAFTASGTYTPTAGYKRAIAFVTGGGGGGDSSSSATSATNGGGAGATAISAFSLVSLAPQAVTVGAGGGSAANGGQSSIGSIVVASGGLSGNSPSLGVGGSTGTGNLIINGGSGFDSYGGLSGGSSFWGSGGVNKGSSTPLAATAFGSGGAAPQNPSSGSINGGSGKSGVVLILEFK